MKWFENLRGPWLPAMLAVALFSWTYSGAEQSGVLADSVAHASEIRPAVVALREAPPQTKSIEVSPAIDILPTESKNERINSVLLTLAANQQNAGSSYPSPLASPYEPGIVPVPVSPVTSPTPPPALARGVSTGDSAPAYRVIGTVNSSPANRYRLRAGDLVEVYVWGQESLSGKFRISRDGTITLRLAGTLEIMNLTAMEASALVGAAFSPFLVLPAVTVSVAEASGKDILLVGEVDAPGIYPLDRPMSLLELLIRAKYKAASADLSSVTVIRDKRPMRCNLSAVMRGDRVEENLDLESGDVVVVPGREIVIGIHGAALKPGRYHFERDRTVTIRDLLMEGSMWSTNAALADAFVLRQDGALEKVDINALWFRGDVLHDRVLRNGDALVLPEVPLVGVYVLGKVQSPGLFQLNGTPNVLQALSLAHPDNFAARLWDARLVRGWPGDPHVFPLNLQAILEGDLTQNMTLKHGDVIYVPETATSYNLEFWNRLLQPINGAASTVSTVRDISGHDR